MNKIIIAPFIDHPIVVVSPGMMFRPVQQKHVGSVVKLTARQRGIVTRSGMARAMGGAG